MRTIAEKIKELSPQAVAFIALNMSESRHYPANPKYRGVLKELSSQGLVNFKGSNTEGCLLYYTLPDGLEAFKFITN